MRLIRTYVVGPFATLRLVIIQRFFFSQIDGEESYQTYIHTYDFKHPMSGEAGDNKHWNVTNTEEKVSYCKVEHKQVGERP